MVVADYQKPNWQIQTFGRSSESGVQAFYFPIISDQQENEFTGCDAKGGTRLVTVGEPGLPVEVARVDCVANHEHIRAAKKTLELLRNQSRDGRKRDVAVAVNATLERHQQPVVKKSMKCKRPLNR